MTACIKTDAYDVYLQKQKFLSEAKYNLNRQCCDKLDCDDLGHSIEQSIHLCDDIFGKYHDTDSKGRVIGEDTVCYDLREKRKRVQQQLGGRKKTNKQRKKGKTKIKTKIKTRKQWKR